MDISQPSVAEPELIRTQRTVRSEISCVGVGLHSGRRAELTIRPAPAGHGIVFVRTDLGRAAIVARFDNVVDTRLCTVLADPARPSARVGTVEHLMAAFSGLRIDNAVVEVDGPELPILDGSAAPFLFLLDCAGIADQGVARPVLDMLRPVRVEAPDGGWAELRPALGRAPSTLDIAASIDFPDAAIGQQSLSIRVTPASFRDGLASARTFTRLAEVEQARAMGLALGGSLDNAIVVDGGRVLNPGGLRMADEFVRHKVLDVVGDLALAGGAIRGRLACHRSGHALNNRLLRALFADASAWRWTAAIPASQAAITSAPALSAAA